MNQYYNMNCMDGMRLFPDKFFDLAICDPPYGIGVKNNMGRRHGEKRSGYPKAYWDKEPPPPEYFEELFRVAKHSIIWGGNYFDLPPTKCFLIWDKKQPENVSFASCEYAWTSLDGVAKTFYMSPMNTGEYRIHPTQKPVALYEWIISRYAKEGDKILDTHAGSGSCCIAAHNLRHEWVGFEIDKQYYEKASKRIAREMAQMSIYDFMGGGNSLQPHEKMGGSRA